VAGAVRKAFHSRAKALLWPAFQYYVLPVLMYLTPAWSPKLKCDSDALEKVQRRFTKCISGLHDLPYPDRLDRLHALTLSHRRTLADMVFIYKCMHGLVNFPAIELGLELNVSNTRSNGCRLYQRHSNSATNALFSVRATSMWNKLPVNIVSCTSLKSFKQSLYNYLFSLQ
jgi:hypothetical protein